MFALSTIILHSCTGQVSEKTGDNDKSIVLQTVLNMNDLQPFFHLENGIDTIVRILNNDVIKRAYPIKVNGEDVMYSETYSSNERYVEFLMVDISSDKAKIELEIPFEGVHMKTSLVKKGDKWLVESNSLVEK